MYFLVDKTGFIREWRPRRFGKTLNMSMVERFFLDAYAGRADLFEGLEVWDRADLRAEQGVWPVVALSFAGVKERTFVAARRAVCQRIVNLHERNRDPLDSPLLGGDRTVVLRQCARRHGRRDDGVCPCTANSALKTNGHLECVLVTGATRVGRESIFSRPNSLAMVAMTSVQHQTSFGFTEAEVFGTMGEMELSGCDEVRSWYDGFRFGDATDIYNPWSITSYLEYRRIGLYWANTSGNVLASGPVRAGAASSSGASSCCCRGSRCARCSTSR